MKKRTLWVISLFFSAAAAVHADIKILNPVPGTWANKQMLVLDVSGDEEAFYSLNGSDPVSSGFAYDSPVLLDVTGPVELRVVVMNGDTAAGDTTVSYTVNTAEPSDSTAASFVDSVTAQGMVDYAAGASFAIPASLSYSFGGLPESFQPGAAVSFAADCILSRTIPCTVTDGTSKWRFIIRTFPSQTGVFTRRDVPFTVTDWSTVTFTSNKFMYKIDDSYWGPAKVPVQLDRSVSHVISWQSVALAPGNPVQSFELPPRPALYASQSKSGAVTAVLRGAPGYRFGAGEDGTVVLFEIAGIDTFPGDEVKGVFNAAVYCDSVYQGTVSLPYDVDRRAPSPPVIASSAQAFYSRKNVVVTIHGSDNSDLYTAVSGPVPVTDDMLTDPAHSSFNSITADDYTLSADGTVKLASSSDSAVYYKVNARSVDAKGNTSAVSSYEVVIDLYNYYLDSSASGGADADGSRLHPFTTFEQCADVLQNTRYAHITVTGPVQMPKGETVISANCVIEGKNDARLVFTSGSSVVVRSASLTVTDCVLERTSAEEDDTGSSFIRLEHSVLSLDGCEVTAVSGTNGTAIDAVSSVITLNDTGITSKAAEYASCVTSVAAKVKVKNSRFSSVAATAVNFSAQDGEFELRSSSCSITGS